MQRNNNLTVTGKVDDQTMSILKKSTKKLTPTSFSAKGTAILETGKKFFGTPYVFGGTTPKGFDCSGFVQYVFAKNSIKLPRTADLQYKVGTVTKNPQIGDLVFFEDTERRKAKSKVNVAENITHVGIVTRVDGDGTVEFIHHSNGKNILDYMNFNFPKQTLKDGKKINTYMKRCPSKNGAVQTACLNIAFFVGYGTF